jgi:hypothetical protein
MLGAKMILSERTGICQKPACCGSFIAHFVETGELLKANTTSHGGNMVYIWGRNLSNSIMNSNHGYCSEIPSLTSSLELKVSTGTGGGVYSDELAELLSANSCQERKVSTSTHGRARNRVHEVGVLVP